MSSFMCCLPWLVLGILLGWLLSWWFSRCCRSPAKPEDSSPPPATKQEALPTANTLAAAAPVASVAPDAPKPSTVKAPAKPKSKPKAKTKSAAKPILPTDPALLALAKVAQKGGRDNLEIVEGIGPKIAELLRKGGINTFAKLGSSNIAALNKILDAAGPRYRLAKPDSWPQQAKLANSGDWKGLKALQDSLTGGVKK